MPEYALRSALLVMTCLLCGCASAPRAGYPVFEQADALPDVFLVGLPGVRGKRLSGNSDTREASNRVRLPADWSFSTGGMPDKDVELYVLAGEIELGGMKMQPGGYAFLPAGSMGFSLSTVEGAEILYFLDSPKPGSRIRSPLVTSRELVPWSADTSLEGFGLAEKTLREDPGSGARTWLLRVEPGATLPWLRSAAAEEGYLLEGAYRHVECVDGETLAGRYLAGGYYRRPAGIVNGGPESSALEPSVWFLRRDGGAGDDTVEPGCAAAGS